MTDGFNVGVADGATDGLTVGLLVGKLEGTKDSEGVFEGLPLGTILWLGLVECTGVGLLEGCRVKVGAADGFIVGDVEGESDGGRVGLPDGRADGYIDSEGAIEGLLLGSTL